MRKQDRAIFHCSQYRSIILDGTDQCAFGIPYFTNYTKNRRGHGLKVKLVSVLYHAKQNFLHLFTMTQKQETGANHIIEAIHRFINRRRIVGQLPRKLFVQLNNCSREHKNKYLMSYFEYLISARAFDLIEVGFLPVVHTHEDMYQCFSQTSARLCRHNAVALAGIHPELVLTNKGNVSVSHMKRIINFFWTLQIRKVLAGSFTGYELSILHIHL